MEMKEVALGDYEVGFDILVGRFCRTVRSLAEISIYSKSHKSIFLLSL